MVLKIYNRLRWAFWSVLLYVVYTTEMHQGVQGSLGLCLLDNLMGKDSPNKTPKKLCHSSLSICDLWGTLLSVAFLLYMVIVGHCVCMCVDVQGWKILEFLYLLYLSIILVHLHFTWVLFKLKAALLHYYISKKKKPYLSLLTVLFRTYLFFSHPANCCTL